MLKTILLTIMLGCLATAYVIAETEATTDHVSSLGVKSTSYKTTVTQIAEDDPILKTLPPADGKPHITTKTIPMPDGGTKIITTKITLTRISVTSPYTTETTTTSGSTVTGETTTTGGSSGGISPITDEGQGQGNGENGGNEGNGVPQIQPVFRWWSSKDLDHFYCLDPKGEIAPQVGYTSEGIEFCTLKTQVEGSVPLYRLYGGKSDHFYTTDADEARRSGYSSEGNIGYIFPNAASLTVKDADGNVRTNEKTIPLYRWYQPTFVDHFYCVDPTKEQIKSNNYQAEGIAGYVFSCKPEEKGVEDPNKPITIKETDTQQIFRWWSQKDADHFYTLDPAGEIAPQVGYVYEGIEFCTLKTKIANSTEFYRLYGGNADHFYTTDDNEAARSGYGREGNIGYVFTGETTLELVDDNGRLIKKVKTIPLYRWYQAQFGDHFYFVDPTVEKHKENNYQDEGIAAYVFPCKQSAATADNQPSVKETDIQPVYRWWSGKAGDHFYCLDPNGEIAPQVGYVYEGIEFCTLKTQVGSSNPLFRLWGGNSDHFYTTDANEAARSGYSREGHVGYIFPSPTSVKVLDASGRVSRTETLIPLYRWYQGGIGDHFYCVDPKGELAPTSGYTAEGVAGYVFPCKDQPKAADNLLSVKETDIQPVYRWWSGKAGDHFYCLDPKGEIAPQVGYTSEGIEFCTLKTQVGGSNPLFRLWGGRSDHFYTTDEAEAQRSRYSREGNIGYVFPKATTLAVTDANGNTKTETLVPLYRWYNGKIDDHFYCVDPKGEIAPQSGYSAEGVAAYVFSCKGR